MPSYEIPARKVTIEPGVFEYIERSDDPSREFVQVRFFARRSAVAAEVDRIRDLAEDRVVQQRAAYRVPGPVPIFEGSGEWRQV